MKQTTQQRLNQLMSERNLKQVDILNMSLPLQKETGIKMSKSHLSSHRHYYLILFHTIL